MGYRLSKITTRTGDDGSTGLGDGSRTSKDAARVEALGDVDELNSQIGVVLAENLPAAVGDLLSEVQHGLFDLGGELSIPGYTTITEDHLAALDAAIARHNAALPPLEEFILPAGSRAASLCHVARTVCRRAERRVVTLARNEPVSPLAVQYLNRLSDLLFILCRVLNRHAGLADVCWQPKRHAPAE
ncbi:ATP:cob(I)alamin adenosyltransferase [Sulfuriferula plumbiphila]|uniref:Cobalamin adenosyltransferase n=1 Tax=Sulfuriferula plumbiphila TaxID=171865 RepID=A0A512L7J6_9PROT|nr:cob(I)yrinic acid a,c-diamide adenosyltransferase [Sulfuriferula plumbiphila]BBP04051.1 ATP:cob(I)alamin adenosyltransferase [Sulfuriferula plumbiphila]GEP30432.1 ATP:cob(I)alamin adenosyltransferase [Sulfuriferula plumbiphila]